MKNYVMLGLDIKAQILKAAKIEGIKVSPQRLTVNATEQDGVYSVTIATSKGNEILFAGRWKTERTFKQRVQQPEQIAVMMGIIRPLFR
ncbi:hypothetical protein PXY30_004454 [Salmonella enterica]|nr:hypothetical protein [Salmonella enterica]EKN6871991.1 hypothetical protein [Salmonella enterica]